ncbi:MAG TPA: aldo/keto reductase [Verrucomicrobiae bacterium]|nr:aldo/keto reductase [Verrucomicrobiae bacterium]
MASRAFGNTGWRVTPVGLGCWEFGGAIMLDGRPDGWTGVDDAESIATIRRAVDLGMNFFDTSDMYGWGHSEAIVGKALKDAAPRDRVYIATKVGFWHNAAGRRTLNESKDYILQACDASLRRLQTDYLDVYQCHLWRTERWAEFLDAFETLQRQGKIRFFGVSTNDFDLIRHFDERRSLASVQANYNLLDRHAEKEILPYCRAHGVAFIARGPLAMGRLSGKYTKDTKFDADDIRTRWLEGDNRKSFERDIEIVELLKPVAAKGGSTMAQLAIKFVLSHANVSVVIPGAKSHSQLEQNFAAGQLPPLTHVEMAAVERALAAGAAA